MRKISMAEDLVLYRLQGAVAVLTLNRPERKNAWTIPLQRHYLGLLERCEHDPAVRAIVVTGAGPTFCPGADTAELTVYTQTGDFNPEMAQIEQPDYYPLLVGKPMIAAINGACAGPARQRVAAAAADRRQPGHRAAAVRAHLQHRRGGCDGADTPDRSGRGGAGGRPGLCGRPGRELLPRVDQDDEGAAARGGGRRRADLDRERA
jgi:hypothetical protein